MPGKSFRWRLINSSGEVSSEWVIFTTKNSDDVYLASKDTEGLMKISLHESGVWNVGLTSEAASRAGIKSFDRHTLKVLKQEEVGQGWKLAVQICVPESELQKPMIGAVSKATNVPMDINSPATSVQVFLQSENSQQNIELPNSYPVCALKLPSGGMVFVVANGHALPWDPQQEFQLELEEARNFYQATESPIPRVTRDHMMGKDNVYGTIYLVEMVLNPRVD